ncbi:MarR family winged helix-turn-helix transcriptional regulator [uncultured Roseovarius sp.]|uniref:MarR family winged helix-turn-helix transcriptional regulator n=1 Tax=uncultured Roseovarius sp. TaxID=293344 RepID=UPI0025D6F24B|nr:MarR family winged helix-turn-helix transcriptional regulator [uncultured Roseovarius sp.]
MMVAFHLIAKIRQAQIEVTAVLAWVALNEGKTQKQLRDSLGMASSTSSRNLAALSKVHRLGKPGLELIEWHESLEDRRQKLLYLSPKGRKFVADVLRIIAGNVDS